jgi:ABC-type microcin C transport system permease subunit YejB
MKVVMTSFYIIQFAWGGPCLQFTATPEKFLMSKDNVSPGAMAAPNSPGSREVLDRIVPRQLQVRATI